MDACIASGHREVSKAAASILAAGGNAFDAAVAAGFCSAVVEPALTSLGGGGFLLAVGPDAEPVIYDFFVDEPGRGLPPDARNEAHFVPVTIQFDGTAQDFNIGPGSAAVPGVVKGLLHVHEKRGRLPLADVTAPAIALAEGGAPVDEMMAYTFHILHRILCHTDEGRAMFGFEGGPLPQGQIITNRPLAAFLRALPESAESLYGGEIGAALVQAMRDGGGLLTLKDLRGYRVHEREPLRVDYHGHHVVTNPRPSLGGSLIGVALTLLDRLVPLAQERFASDEHMVRLARAMRETEWLREQGITDPSFLEDGLVRDAAGRIAERGTTHCTISDFDGNVASMTTSNGEGSGYYIPGTGIMINNMLGEHDLHDAAHQPVPGMRVRSMMSPCAVLTPDASPFLILGSGGSKRIRTAITQVLTHVVDFNCPLQDAVDAPRVHFEDEALQLEPGYPASVVEALGHIAHVNEWQSKNLYFGGVHSVMPQSGQAGADSRRGGAKIILPDTRAHTGAVDA